MLTRTQRFDDALKYGAQTVAVVDIYRAGAIIVPNVPLDSGVVHLDITAEHYRSMDVSVVDEYGLLTPQLPSDPLQPYNGNEAKVKAGFQFPDGTQELKTLGVFRIEESSLDEPGLVRISGIDRSVVVKEARFEAPYFIASGTTDIAAIRTLIEARVANLDWTLWPTNSVYSMQATVFEEGSRSGDPWTICQDIATNGGREVLFDNEGRPILRTIANPVVAVPTWVYSVGTDSIVMKSNKKISTQGVSNVWVVMGENASSGLAPVSAKAEITDTTSPIFPSPVGFGRRPAFYASQYLTTVAQCQTVADNMKAAGAGWSEVVGFTAIPHLCQEGRDVVQVVDAETGINLFVVLSSFDLDVFLSSETSFATIGRRD